MANARVAVDYFGTGNLQDIFQGTLPLSYVQGVIDVPPVSSANNGFGAWEFTVPIDNPYLLLGGMPTNADAYFEYVSGRTWRVQIVGRTHYIQPGNNPALRYDLWNKPNFNTEGQVKIYYGGYRG